MSTGLWSALELGNSEPCHTTCALCFTCFANTMWLGSEGRTGRKVSKWGPNGFYMKSKWAHRGPLKVSLKPKTRFDVLKVPPG